MSFADKTFAMVNDRYQYRGEEKVVDLIPWMRRAPISSAQFNGKLDRMIRALGGRA